MPFASRDGVRLYWKVDGETERPAVVLLNSIGTDMSLWDKALPYLLPHYRLIRMDSRGHGASDAPDGDYSLDTLARDVIAVMDAAGAGSALLAGISLGGMIAMQVAVGHPDRVSGLGLICTSASMDKEAWTDRVNKVRAEGTGSIADLAMSRFFSSKFVQTHPAEVETVRRSLISASDAGYAGCAAAIRDMDILDHLGAITAPTLIVCGNQDTSTPFSVHGERLAATIPNARTTHLEAAHLASIENPAALTAALVVFFSGDEQARAAREVAYEAGLRRRRAVLGDAWVDKALADRTSFNADFQAMITRIAWDGIWNRPGLDERTRRLVVIASTASLGRWEEFALHVRAGLVRGGFTQDELKEVLMQIAIYAGVPTANSAFAEASKIISDIG